MPLPERRARAPRAGRAPGAGRVRRLALASILGLCAAAAWAQATIELPSLEAWQASVLRVDALEARRAALREAVLIAARERGEARAAGDAARERALLSRGEALADSIEQTGVALLAESLRRVPLAARLSEEIERAIGAAEAGPSSAGGQVEERLAQLRALGARVRSVQVGTARGEFPLPEAAQEDPPEILRQKAAYARDLVDRADRWLGAVGDAAERLAEARLARDAERMLADQAFFDPQASLALDRPGTGAREAAAGAFEGLLAQVSGQEAAGAVEAAEVLDLLRGYLESTRAELERRAAELEREAERRENEG